jgi:hypothetical protein
VSGLQFAVSSRQQQSGHCRLASGRGKGDATLYRTESLAKKPRPGIEPLPAYITISGGRAVWPHIAASPRGGFWGPTNIAEGAKRQGKQDYARFLNIAQGSLAETEYLVMLSRDLGYLAPEKAKEPLSEISEIAGMLHALRKKVEGGGS